MEARGREGFKNSVRTLVPRPIRNWFRSPSKAAVWIWDAAKYSVGFTQTLRIGPDVSIICHPHAYKVAREAQIIDPEQTEEFQSFLSTCSSDMLLFDIGAHFGIFSLAAAHFGGKSIAVDPSPIATRMIARQAALNGWTSKIQILQAAVNDTGGTVHMLNSGVFGEGYFKFVLGRSKTELTATRAVTIDQMSSQYGVPTHIKVDVEGQEAAALRGGRNTLAKFAPVLFLELHTEMIVSQGGDPCAALDEVRDLGYRAFSFNGVPVVPAEIFEKPICRIVANHSA